MSNTNEKTPNSPPETTSKGRVELSSDDLLAHCDGQDCRCAARSEYECVCDADWTPREVYQLQAAILKIAAKSHAHRNELMNVIEDAHRLVMLQSEYITG